MLAEEKLLRGGMKCVLQTQESVVSLQLFSGITQISLIKAQEIIRISSKRA